MTAPTDTEEAAALALARSRARTVSAWRRINACASDSNRPTDQRILIRAGVLTRPGVWHEDAVSIRTFADMLRFLRKTTR